MINKYPYTDFHEINLDWILSEIMKLHHDYDEFKAVNTITNAGAWDITKQYQAWTVVSDNNAGYISLKPVPVGIAISNAEYWGLIADYNILITNLSARISALESAVNTINNVTIPTITADEMIFLGDSYGVDATAGGKAWSSYVADVYPEAYINCIGGMGFASDMYLTQNFLTMLQSMVIPDHNKIKSIFVFGGANDANLIFDGISTSSDIESRIHAFASYAKTAFPNAKVYISFIGWYRNNNRFNAYTEAYNTYASSTQECSNAVYIRGLEGIMKNDDYINSLDYIHPVAAASETLAQFILEIIKTRSDVSYYKVFDTAVTPDASISNILGVSAAKKIIYDDNKVTIAVFGTANANMHLDVRPASNITIGNGTIVTVCKFDNSPRSGVIPLSSYQTILIHDTSNNLYEVPVKLMLYSRDLIIQFLQTTSYPDVNQILIMSPIILEGYTF